MFWHWHVSASASVPRDSSCLLPLLLISAAGTVKFQARPPQTTTTTTTTTTIPTTISSMQYILSTFISETKGKPARISLLRYPDRCGSADNPKSGPFLVSKSFYQAEECTTHWSPQGDAVLILTTTSVDSSGESYYGSTNLYLLLSDVKTRSIDGEALAVPLPGGSAGGGGGNNNNNGPVLDVSWMPNANKPSTFAVISGKMPALTSLHHGTTAEPIFLLGNAHRNTIVWSTHGRFLTIGGFGNLAGGMDFIDRNKMKPMMQYDPETGVEIGNQGNQASCAVGYGWSPDSRFFMVSTTSPRMNVDNGVTVVRGGRVVNVICRCGISAIISVSVEFTAFYELR